MIYIVRINDKNYEVEVERGRANIIAVTEASPASKAPAAPAPAQAAPAAPQTGAPAAGDKTITAPMPGTVLDIKVAPGKSVEKGDILLVLEAMKMENEVLAPFAGVVSQILVGKGATVDTGDPLISMQ